MEDKILITGIGGAAGISVAKSLNEFYLVGVDANPNAPGKVLVNEFYQIPYAREENFVEELTKIAKECYCMFCTVDEELPIVAKNMDVFGCKVLVSPLESIERCLDKFALHSYLRDRGLPTPKTVLLENQSFEELMTELGPFIVKPRRGRGSRDFFEVKNEDYFRFILSAKNYLKKEFICQKELKGKEYSVDVLLDENGKFLIAVPRERILTDSGISIVGKTVINPKLQEIVPRIVEALGLKYIVNVQLKEDENGEPYVTEVNPRPAGTLYLTTLSGVNMPRLLIKLLAKEEIEPWELRYEELIMYRLFEEKIAGKKEEEENRKAKYTGMMTSI